MKENLKASLFVLFVIGLVAGLVWLDHYVWRLKHPQAPAWTYFFRA
jgi:hypothetical protein